METTTASRSTPLNQLPQTNGSGSGSGSDDDSQFVDKILKKMETDNSEVDQQYDNQQNSYNDQQFGLTPQQLGYQQQQQQQQQYMSPEEQQQQQQMQEQYMNQNQFQEPTKSLAEKVKEGIKQPIIFLVLYMVLSAPPVRKLIMTQLERFTTKPSLQLWGTTFFAAVIGGVLFYVANRFI